jgi:hypothetical protein
MSSIYAQVTAMWLRGSLRNGCGIFFCGSEYYSIYAYLSFSLKPNRSLNLSVSFPPPLGCINTTSIMKSFRKIIHSIASFLDMSSDPSPQRSSTIDVHRVWFSSPGASPDVATYSLHLLDFYSTLGAVPGPDDWYVAQVETYKGKKGFRHELLLVTIQRTPRVPRQNKERSSDSRPDDVSVVPRQAQSDDISGPQTGFLIIERRVDRDQNKQGESQSDRSNRRSDENANGGGTSSPSDLSKESLRMKLYTVGFLASKQPALDEVSHILSKDGMGGSDLMGSMVLPKPPTLHADNDFRTVFDQLSESAPPEGTSSASPSSYPPTAAPLSPPPRFISVPALLCLAKTISESEKAYSLVQHNCYWYCSMIFYALRRYTGANIVLHGKRGTTTVGPEESPSAAKEKFNDANITPGRIGPVDVVYPPTNETIDNILSRWAENRAEMETKVRELRFLLFVLSADLNQYRRMRLDWVTRLKEADEKAKAADEKAKAADERNKDADEKAKAADEKAKAADEKAKAADERTKAADEKAKAADERTKAADERNKDAEEGIKAAHEMAKAARVATEQKDKELMRLRAVLAARGIEASELECRYD